MTLFCLMILCILWGLQIQASSRTWILPPLFALLLSFAGFLGGYQFVLANRIIGVEKNIGRLYALDLTGSAAGAMLISLFLIPIYGLPTCLLFLFTLNGSVWVLLKMNQDDQPGRLTNETLQMDR